MKKATAAFAAAAAVLAPACSRNGSSEAERAPASAAGTYVAVGASETVGVGAADPARDAWPTVLHRTALRETHYVNVGISGATVAQALAEELPEALRHRPTVVTVWLNVNDILRVVRRPDYERDLRTLVRALRQDGRAAVLVANTPPLERLPAYLACLPGAAPTGARCVAGVTLPGPDFVRFVVGAYNEVIERVVREEGAVLVDLHQAGIEARERGIDASLVSGDGFHPSTLGHHLVAEEFAETLRSVDLPAAVPAVVGPGGS